MKQLTVRFVIPLTLILFASISKWWYVLVIDGTDELLTGFPLPFVCRGFHTSMSLQFFILEFLVDIFTYFGTVFIVVYLINRFVFVIKLHKILSTLLFLAATFILAGSAFLASDHNNLFFVKRPFDIEVMDSGVKFNWQDMEYPDYYKYHPERRPEK